MEIKELESYSFGNELKKIKQEQNALVENRVGFFQKNVAALVDFAIVIVIRMLIGSIIAAVWYKVKIKNIAQKVTDENVVQFIISNNILYDIAIFTVVVTFLGGLYYIFMYSSRFEGTVGCLLFDMKMVKKSDLTRVSILRSIARYTLFVFPIVFIILIAIKIYFKSFDLLFILLALGAIFWYDIPFFTRMKQTVPDLICGTILISTKKRRTSYSFPFLNFKKYV